MRCFWDSLMGPTSSTGSPRTLMIRPRHSRPTGTCKYKINFSLPQICSMWWSTILFSTISPECYWFFCSGSVMNGKPIKKRLTVVAMVILNALSATFQAPKICLEVGTMEVGTICYMELDYVTSTADSVVAWQVRFQSTLYVGHEKCYRNEYNLLQLSSMRGAMEIWTDILFCLLSCQTPSQD